LIGKPDLRQCGRKEKQKLKKYALSVRDRLTLRAAKENKRADLRAQRRKEEESVPVWRCPLKRGWGVPTPRFTASRAERERLWRADTRRTIAELDAGYPSDEAISAAAAGDRRLWYPQ
jgi:Zn-dependent oligopeptidase